MYARGEKDLQNHQKMSDITGEYQSMWVMRIKHRSGVGSGTIFVNTFCDLAKQGGRNAENPLQHTEEGGRGCWRRFTVGGVGYTVTRALSPSRHDHTPAQHPALDQDCT